MGKSKKRLLNMENTNKELNKGVFWLIGDELLVVKYDENATVGISKNGTNYNHKEIWEHVKPRGVSEAFDYYPRGRLEISNKGRPLIYMSKYIDGMYIPKIMEKFGLTDVPIIHIDGSTHYRCHYDDSKENRYI